MNSTQLAPDGRQSSRTSHSDDLPGDDSFELYPDDMLHRMFSMDTRDTGRCDTATGQCACFAGYAGVACHTLSALA